MAVVEFKRCKDLAKSVRYVQEERGPDDVVSAKGCSVSTAVEDFRNVKREFNNTRKTQTLHLVQSWHPKESNLKTPEEFHAMGRQLVEEMFPGHQYVIRTHTDQDHIHNHIAVNTVNQETGAYLENRYFVKGTHDRFIGKLRQTSDRICKENGLSVLHEDALERRARLPKHVQNMERAKKDSWTMDLIQKAAFSKALSTSYDEYVDHMKSFKIDVHVEDKNIRYLYPGETRWKRGKTLTPDQSYNKERLEEAFRENDLLFKANPKLRSERLQEMNALRSQSGRTARDEEGKPFMPNGQREVVQKDYQEFTKVPRRKREKTYAGARALKSAGVPVDEIRRAQGSIWEYCEKSKIPLTLNAKGEKVLKGREYVVVKEFETMNGKNGTTGSLIEFVAAHHDLTFFQAVAKITGNKRLLLLEQAKGKKGREFTSFYIPKEDSAHEPEGKGKVSTWLSQGGAKPDLADGLIKAGHVKANSEGKIHLFSEEGHGEGAEFTREPGGEWKMRKGGKARFPFFSGHTSGSQAQVYLDPLKFLAQHGESMLLNKKALAGIVALFEPEHGPVDRYVNESRTVRQVYIAPSHGLTLSSAELDFFNVLKKRFDPFGIEVKQGHADRAIGREGPDLGR